MGIAANLIGYAKLAGSGVGIVGTIPDLARNQAFQYGGGCGGAYNVSLQIVGQCIN